MENEQGRPGEEYTCNFCKKSQHDVRKLIVQAPEAAICSECVKLCNDVISFEDGVVRFRQMEERLNAFCTDHSLTPKLGLVAEMAWVLGFQANFELKPRAQGMETRQGGDGTAPSPDDSPVRQDAPDTPLENTNHD